MQANEQAGKRPSDTKENRHLGRHANVFASKVFKVSCHKVPKLKIAYFLLFGVFSTIQTYSVSHF